jgi:hypothetical protein
MSIPQTNIRVQARSPLPDTPGTAYQTFPWPVPSPLTVSPTATWGSGLLPDVLKPAAATCATFPTGSS